MTERILMVDDEENILSAYGRVLRRKYDLVTALGGAEGIAQLKDAGPFSVLVTDMRMPEVDGLQVLAAAKELCPDTVRIMLTGNADQQTAIDAVNQGEIFRFLNKPCNSDVLSASIEAGIRQFQLVNTEKDLLKNTLRGALDMLVEVAGMVDAETFGRARAIADLAEAVSKELGEPMPWNFAMAGLLSQIGALTLPQDLLSKIRKGAFLNSEERELSARLPEIGASLLRHIPRLEQVAEAVYYMQKNINGSGFPSDDKRGGTIPLGGRILRVVSDFLSLSQGKDPITTTRDMAFRSTWYDFEVLRALETVLQERADATPKTPLSIGARQARLGMVLVMDVETPDRLLVIPGGTRLGISHLERLRNFARVGNLREPFDVWES